MGKILSLKNIYVGRQEIVILRDISFEIEKGEIVSIVGESGCGKSLTLRTIINLLPQNFKILKGKIIFEGENITEFDEERMRNIRGKKIGIIFQEPSSYLNPLFTIGNQIQEAIMEKMSKKEKKEKVIKILEEIGLSSINYNQYPHQLSGGMQQRAMIAMAIINNPLLLLADEPTTALDVTTAFSIINLLKKLVLTHNLSIIFVTHDISLAKFISEKIIVMYSGVIVESGPSDLVYNEPLHPYTKKLIDCLPERYKKGEKIRVIEGEVPSFKNLPSGCPFYPRCKFRKEKCEKFLPEEIKIDKRAIRCFNYGNIVEG
ncbi:MAG: ABC transporter ATP-binding protein [Candidatus Ratteibacteria bacterium]